VPNSPWIATVRARLLGTVEAAEQANAFAFDDIPAQLALASALLNENRLELAAKVLRRFNSRDYPEAAALNARMYLLKNDAKRAVTEAMIGKPVAPDLDSFQVSVRRTEPTSGLDWPWIDAQVEALAKAQLGKADEGARRLGGIPVGTLKELREAVAQNTKAAEQLMNAMSRLIEDTRDKGVPRDEMAVSLARLRVIADQTDLAAALVSASPKRLTPFCTGLSSLLWTLGSIQSRPTAHADRLRAMCTPKSPNATPVTEPMECSIP
jgi:hypothetical protein